MEMEGPTSERSVDMLDTHYDLIVQGTGLVQSMISCAAARIGKKVMHVDRNGYYGEEYANFSLHSLASRFVSNENPGSHSVAGCEGSSGDGKIVQLKPSQPILPQVIVDMSNNTKGCGIQKIESNPKKYHPACFSYLMERSSDDSPLEKGCSSHPVFGGYVQHKGITPRRVLSDERRFNIDLTCRLLYGGGNALDFFISSDVARYLEFKTLNGLHFWVGAEGINDAGKLWKVPSSKVDVFNSKMLGAVEKRALMKFHQYIVDWGRFKKGLEVSTLNERDMGVGRALYRPQNKRRSESDFDLDGRLDRPVAEFLNSCKLSPRLQKVIIFALCGHSFPFSDIDGPVTSRSTYSSESAMLDMFQHLDSLSRYGQSAFLIPLYGTGEVVQAFCRMSAVWGSTFILNRHIQSIQVEYVPDSDLTVESSPTMTSNEPVNDNGGDVSSSSSGESFRSKVTSVRDSEGNNIKCDALVISALEWPSVTIVENEFLISAISIWLGNPLTETQSLVVIPPNAIFTKSQNPDELCCVNNPAAVHIILQDEATCVTPKGSYLVHITTTYFGNQHEKLGADSNTSRHEGTSTFRKETAARLIDHVIALLVSSQDAAGGNTSSKEVYRAVNINPVVDRSYQADPLIPSNLALCPCAEQAISFDDAFNDAQAVFLKLYPNEDFSLRDCAPPPEVFKSSEIDEETSFLQATLSAVSQTNEGVDQNEIENV